jgi:hypothetical protein
MVNSVLDEHDDDDGGTQHLMFDAPGHWFDTNVPLHVTDVT